MNNQKILLPNYYESFKCIAGECEDTCCSGWKIIVDEDTYNKYQNIDDNNLKVFFNNKVHRLENSKNSSDYGIIENKENGDCAFLAENKLCNIYLTLGENHLCTTCRNHPRHYNYVDKVIEKSLSVSCPEACRKILFKENPIEFFENEEYIEEITIHDSLDTLASTNEFDKYFGDIRIFTIKVLQTRNLTIEQRLSVLALFFDEINNNKEKNIKDTIATYENNIECRKYNDFVKIHLDKDDVSKTQLLFILRTCNRLLNTISSPGYFNNFVYIVKGLNLDGNLNYDILKSTYTYAQDNIYNSFMSSNQNVYENYLVNYVYKTLFPKTNMSLFDTYINLFLNFAILKFNIIGLCSYYGSEIDRAKLVYLVSNFTRMIEHSNGINEILNKFAKDNNFNTLEDILLVLGC